MLYVSLAIAIVALLLAWQCRRTTRDLRERNFQLNSKIYSVRTELAERLEQQQQELMKLRFELLRQSGELAVTGEMTVDEISRLHPQAAAVLAGFHLGGCSSCAVDGSQRLAEAALANGRALEPILVALNALVVEGANDSLPAGQLRTPNVQLML